MKRLMLVLAVLSCCSLARADLYWNNSGYVFSVTNYPGGGWFGFDNQGGMYGAMGPGAVFPYSQYQGYQMPVYGQYRPYYAPAYNYYWPPQYGPAYRTYYTPGYGW